MGQQPHSMTKSTISTRTRARIESSSLGRVVDAGEEASTGLFGAEITIGEGWPMDLGARGALNGLKRVATAAGFAFNFAILS